MRKYVFVLITFILIISIATISFGKTTPKNESLNYKIIEVQKGDTLWQIAQEFKDDDSSTKEYVAVIKTFNNMKTDTIKTGQTIIIPIKS